MNSAQKLPEFRLLPDGKLLNVAQIRYIDDIRQGHCRIVFAPDHIQHLYGESADQLITVLVKSTVESQMDSLSELSIAVSAGSASAVLG